MLGVTSETMANWVNDTTRIDTTNLLGLAKLTGVNSAWLQFGQGDIYDPEDQEFLNSVRLMLDRDPNILIGTTTQGPLSDEALHSIAKFMCFVSGEETQEEE